MLDNPYEIVAWAMTDKTNNSIPQARWPYVSTWVSGEPRYEGYCTPVLPANNTYGILGPRRQDEKVVPPRCGMEFLEQLYGASLQTELPPNRAPQNRSPDQNHDLRTSELLSVRHHMHQADETDERVWESERRGRALLDLAAQERFELAQVDAVEELARDNDTFYKGLHRSHRTLYWAERNSREKLEAERKASFGARELLEARYQRVLYRWSTIVYQKSHQLALRITQAAAGVRSRRTHAITKIQSLVRGWLGKIRVRKMRQSIQMRKLLAVAKMQALFRGWKDRRMCRFLRELRTTSSAAKRLFKAQNAFQHCDVDGDGFISADEFVSALKQNGIFLDALAIQAILASLPLKSDYCKAVAAAEKERMYNNDLFLKGKGGKWCAAPLPWQSHPLSFSDFCSLVDLDVSAAAISKMQEAIKIFTKFDADGSGAIDGDEVAQAIEEMQKFTGVPVSQGKLNVSLRLGDGELDFEAFVNVFGLDTGSSDTALDDQVDLAFRAFREIDKVGAGEIGPQELSAGLMRMGVEVGLDEAQQMFDEVIEDGSGKMDFIEFCKVGGLHNISERLKRKYIPGYLGEMEEEEEELNMSMTVPQPGSPAYPSKKEKETRASSFEDGEALVGHPHSLCTPVIGLRVRPSRNFRSGTLNGAGSIVEVERISRSKMRVRVEHDNKFERYYDCGSNGRFELVVLPKVYLTDAQLAVYYKSQPHLNTSDEDDFANTHDKSTGLRRFDHLYRSLFDLQSLPLGQDESSRNKVRAQRKQIIVQIRERLQRAARVKWDRVKILVRSPNNSPSNRNNSGAKHPEATAQDSPSKVPLDLQLADVESKCENVTSSFKRQSSSGPAEPQAVVAQKGTEAPPPAVGAQNEAKASGGSEGTVVWTRTTAGNGGIVATASAGGQLEDQTWEQKMNQRDAELRARRILQGSFRGSFKVSQSRGEMVARTSAKGQLGAPTWEQKINQRNAELPVHMSRGSFRGSFRLFESRDDALTREQRNTKATAHDTSSPSPTGTVSSRASASAVLGASQKDNSEAMEGSMRTREPVGLQSKRQIFGMGASFKGRQSFRNNFTEVALKLSHQTEASSLRRPQGRSSLPW
jgi:Ca2+-binding EF-hand superfamily protein